LYLLNGEKDYRHVKKKKSASFKQRKKKISYHKQAKKEQTKKCIMNEFLKKK
jgi:hypothetical protein